MKGIILAGGSGTRLFPITKSINKQLLPIYDKPMVYYPLSVLMLAGIREILIITTPQFLNNFKELLGDGSQLGINISYETQAAPRGIADGILVGEKFIGKDSVTLILGDNILYGYSLTGMLKNAIKNNGKGATIFSYKVSDPSRYGVVEFKDGKVVNLEEKPDIPKSHDAVVGLYIFSNQVIKYAKEIKASERGELEITEVNKCFLKSGNLKLERLGRGFAWLDTGTNDTLLEASQFVQTIEKRQGNQVACIEEIAFQNNWISINQLKEHADLNAKTKYGKYLLDLAHNENLN